MAADDVICFVLDGEVVELTGVEPTRTVLQYLREDLGRTGSKEGCAEGDCGACTVVVAEPHAGDVRMRAINSCIQFLPTLDGKQLFTVESLAAGGRLHPAQQAMVEEHGSQCGFCTPGFVMSLFALYQSGGTPTRREVDDALAGNLCRCTGYRPIVAAAQRMHGIAGNDVDVDRAALARVQRQSMLRLGDTFFAPQDADELAAVLMRHPQATLLAGGTDVGLWVTKQYRDLGTVIYTGNVRELLRIEETAAAIEIGAAVTLTDAMPPLLRHYPGLDELLRRFASPPIRNAGTLGGNVANGSPIGDSMAALMVIGTELVLRRGDSERRLPLEDFYHDYMQNDLQPGEFLARIDVPLPTGDAVVRSHKWSKRFDQDISAVCTAYRLELDGVRVARFRMACGGMAATVKRARHAEAALGDSHWDSAAIERACDALADDFTPLSDMRATADARLLACRNLLRRFFAETQDPELPTVYEYGRES